MDEETQEALVEEVHRLGQRLAIDDETVAGGLYAVADAIDRLADTMARMSHEALTEPRPGRRNYTRSIRG